MNTPAPLHDQATQLMALLRPYAGLGHDRLGRELCRLCSEGGGTLTPEALPRAGQEPLMQSVGMELSLLGITVAGGSHGELAQNFRRAAHRIIGPAKSAELVRLSTERLKEVCDAPAVTPSKAAPLHGFDRVGAHEAAMAQALAALMDGFVKSHGLSTSLEMAQLAVALADAEPVDRPGIENAMASLLTGDAQTPGGAA